MKKYKYLVQFSQSQEKLNELGNEGWELVDVVWEQTSSGGAYENNRSAFYFKMEINEDQS